MLKSIISVVVPIILWGGLWVAAGQGMASSMPDSFEDGIPTANNVLLIFIVISSFLSTLAGLVCAKIAPGDKMKHVLILAVIQLVIGIGVQASAWTKMPIWYHLIFLALVVPMHWVGGKLGSK